MSDEKLKRTPLYDRHVQLGAKMVPFAGWEMPVQYAGLREEHLCVRKAVGLFDVSHMGEIRFRGPKALATLQNLLSNDLSKLETGHAQYSLLMNPRGGIVDDVITYCLKSGDDYLVCVNASNADKDFAWLQSANRGADLRNESAAWAQIAVQGPKAIALTARVFGDPTLSALKKNELKMFRDWGNWSIVARTGYTGEEGFEIFLAAEKAPDLWDKFLAEGKADGVMPIGLGARDTLRTEMKYPLYGHEIDDDTNPFEAGLGWAVKLSAKDFIGKSNLLAMQAKGVSKKLVAFELLEKGIPRQGYKLFSFDSEEIGTVTSGTHSPSRDCGFGIGYVKTACAEMGTNILVEIRGKMFKAKIVK